jgi:outer membrane lipoprotein-sorting protein
VTSARQQFGIAATVVLLAAVAAGQTAPVDLQTLVQRMAQAQADAHSNVRPYQVTREYKFYQGKEDDSPDSNIVADVSYFPPDTKEYSIVNATGGGRGQHVVKKVLEQESQMSGQWQQSALVEDNYKFSLLGEETLNGRRCFILGLEPRRDAKELIKGKAWVDAQDFRVRQIQGEPAKSPSFWIKKLNLTLVFSDVQGMWLQTAVRADADVRMFGKNVLSERDLSYRVGNAVAVKRTSRRNSSETNIATFIR